MGSGASKKKASTAATVITASNAFKKAGKRASKKRQESEVTQQVIGTRANVEAASSSNPTNNNVLSDKEGTEHGTAQCDIGTDQWGNGTTKYDNGTVQCDSGTTECENGNMNKDATDVGIIDDSNEADPITEETSKGNGRDGEIEAENQLAKESVFKGHQDQNQLRRESAMAIRIQRHFRRHLSTQSLFSNNESEPKGEERFNEDDLDARKEHREQRARAWRDETPELLRREYSMQVGEQTMEEFNTFQDEITMLKWKSEQQIERNLYGGTHSPRKVLFISSNISKSKELTEARLEDVITFNYDFTKETFVTLIDALKANLNAYKNGCGARSICFICKGAPGVLYLLKKRALTVQKLRKECEADQVRFWQSIGANMSKIRPQESMIHVMGCNVMGTEKGQELFNELEELARPSFLKIKAPLELSEEGNTMIATYFDVPKYRAWKMGQYSET